MDGIVTIEIPVTTKAAAALADADRRAALGRYVSRMLCGAGARDLLAEAIAEANAEAQARRADRRRHRYRTRCLQRRTPRLIVVFDASSLVGAALRPGSVPETALLTAMDRGTLAVSREVVDEYRAVLCRPKFAQALSAERREAILELIEVVAQRVQPVERVTDCRDQKDNMYIAFILHWRPRPARRCW